MAAPTAAARRARFARSHRALAHRSQGVRRRAAERRGGAMQQARVLPDDAFNQSLVANVYPLDWQNPVPAERYNLVVIGAGTAGLVTAAGAAGLGARVALIERHLMGGDCLNVGCVPSKCVIRSARLAGDLRTADQLGVRVADTHVDFAAVMARMRRVRAQLSVNDSARRF